MEREKMSPKGFLAMKQRGEKIIGTVCYDYPMALLADRAGMHRILVGDSLGPVALGMRSCVPVTMEDMIPHCEAVARAVKYALVVGDLPFSSCETSIRDAVHNACRLMKCGVDAVKLEGGKEFAPTVKAIVDAGIPTVGHIGLIQETVWREGRYKVQGTDVATASKLIEDAKALEEAGAFLITAECIPDRLAELICKELTIPVVGIGSGPNTDGHALNLYDMLGLYEGYTPKFVKEYVDLSSTIIQAIQQFKEEVEQGIYPAPEYSYHIKDEVLKGLKRSPS